jgi:hypothetical protein
VFSLSDWYVTFKITYSEEFISQRARVNLLPCKTMTISVIPVGEVYMSNNHSNRGVAMINRYRPPEDAYQIASTRYLRFR